MGSVETVTRITYRFLEKFRKFAVYIGEKKNITKKEHLFKNTELTENQKEEIDYFFKKHYGKKIPYKWHKLYQSYTDVYQKDYFPEILFSTKLEPKLNNYYLARLFGDKNLLDLFFNQSVHVTIPKTYISCVNGTYRDHTNTIIRLTTAVNNISNIGEAVIKKSIDTSSGRDVKICNLINGIDTKTNQKVEDIINSMGKDFIIQERITQWVDVSKLYSKSLNTFRVVSYIIGEEIFVCPISLRMGRNNAELDNVHYGGITVGVSKNGYLKKHAYSEYKETFESHPDTGIKFEGYKIDGIEKLIVGAKELHKFIPHLKIISWDLSLNRKKEVVLIEMNTIGQSVWFPQMVNGESMFGENTPYMLEQIS